MSGLKTRLGSVSIGGLTTQAVPSAVKPSAEALQPLSPSKVTILPAPAAAALGADSVSLVPIANLFPPAPAGETRFKLPSMEAIAILPGYQLMPSPLSFLPVGDTTISENQAAKIPITETQTGNLISKFQPEILSVFSYESPFREEASTALSSVGVYQKLLYESNRSNIAFLASCLESSADKAKYATECSRQVSNFEDVVNFGVSIETSKKVTEGAFRFSEWQPNIAAYIAKNYSAAVSDEFSQPPKVESGTGTEIFVRLAADAKKTLRGLSGKQIDLNQSLAGFDLPKYEALNMDMNSYRAFVNSIVGINKFVEQEAGGSKNEKLAKLSAFLKREIAVSAALARSSVTSKFDFFSANTFGYDLYEKVIGAADVASPYTSFASPGITSAIIDASQGIAYVDSVPSKQNGTLFRTGVQLVAETCVVSAGKFQPEKLDPIREQSKKHSKQITTLLTDLFSCYELGQIPEYVNDQIEFASPDGAISLAQKLFLYGNDELISGRDADPFVKLLSAADDNQKLFGELVFYLLTRCFGVNASKAVLDDSFLRVVDQYFDTKSPNTTQTILGLGSGKNAAGPALTTRTQFIVQLNQNTDFFLQLKANLAHVSTICRYLNNTLNFNGRTRYSGCAETTILVTYLRLICQVANASINSRQTAALNGKNGFLFGANSSSASLSAAKKLAKDSERQLCTNLVRIQSFLDNIAASAEAHAGLLKDTKTALQISKLGGLLQNEKAISSLFQAGALRLLQKTLVDAKASMTSIVSAADGAQKATIGYKENALLDGINAVHSYLNQPELSPFARMNARVFAIGIPYGVAEALDEQVRIAGSDNDIVNLSFTRKNELLPGLVFKPIKKMFEYSRFVTFVGENRLNYDSRKSREANMSELVTLDFSGITVAKEVGFSAFVAERYSNLSAKEQFEILSNHYESCILKEHVKAISGLSFDEDAFKEEFQLPTPPPENTNFLQQAISSLISLQAPAATTGSAGKSISAKIGIPRLQSKITSLVSLARNIPAAPQMIAFNTGYLKEVASPIYERVFCVLLDPDFFEIDIPLTKATPTGAATLSGLVASRGVYDDGTGRLYLNADQNFVYMDSYAVEMETR